MIIQKDVGTSSLEKVVQTLDKMQRANPLCATLQLNHLCGGPVDHELPPIGCYTGSLTDYLLANQTKNSFFLLSKQHLQGLVRKNIIRNEAPFFSKSEIVSPNYLLFRSASFLNHSCAPNSFRSFFREDSSVLFVKAIEDI